MQFDMFSRSHGANNMYPVLMPCEQGSSSVTEVGGLAVCSRVGSEEITVSVDRTAVSNWSCRGVYQDGKGTLKLCRGSVEGWISRRSRNWGGSKG